MSEQTKLWTRKANYFIVEILVGKTWTQAVKVEGSEERAREEVAKWVEKDGVSAVRLLEHELEHVCTQVMLEKAPHVVKVAKGMKDTGMTGRCRVCQAVTAIFTDATDRWAVCYGCKRALPCLT